MSPRPRKTPMKTSETQFIDNTTNEQPNEKVVAAEGLPGLLRENTKNYDEWLKEIDNIVEKNFNQGIEDSQFKDHESFTQKHGAGDEGNDPFRDLFDRGETPEQVLKSNKFNRI